MNSCIITQINASASDPDREIEPIIVGLYSILYEDDLTIEEIEFYEVENEHFEAEIYLPHIGVNVTQWDGWSTEKRIEVLIHEFAHTENYEDDHHPDFWDRVITLTEIAIDHQSEIEELCEASFDPVTLKETVVNSIHEYVIESDIDSVSTRKKKVGQRLGLEVEERTLE